MKFNDSVDEASKVEKAIGKYGKTLPRRKGGETDELSKLFDWLLVHCLLADPFVFLVFVERAENEVH